MEKLVLELDVRRGGERLLHERFEQDGAGLRALAALAGAGEGACFGNAVLVAPGLAAAAAPVWRETLHALQTGGVWIGASQLRLGGGWSIKFVAPDGVKLKQTLAAIRRTLAGVSAPGVRCAEAVNEEGHARHGGGYILFRRPA